LKVLFLVPAPANISPGQRFRFEHYLASKSCNDIEFVVKPFLGRKTWSIIHLSNHYLKKASGILFGFIKRFLLLFTLYKYDFVYIYREASIIGPPIFEWLIAKLFKKKIIYDFDDAIWVSMASEANPGAATIKCSWKVASICRMSYIITVGNEFLAAFARQYCDDVRIIPTVVNTNSQHNRLKNHNDLPLYIGWTGTFTNFHSLQKITGVIKELRKKYEFTYLIIADKDPGFSDLEYVYKKWNIETEIDDLLKLHIGLMPLENSEVEMGKCGFKAIQYMSLGIPTVVSPVGANCTVVQDNINGFWAESSAEWYARIEELIKDKQFRERIGTAARHRIVNSFSVLATQQQFFDLFLTPNSRCGINNKAN